MPKQIDHLPFVTHNRRLNSVNPSRIRLVSVADLHQRRQLYRQLVSIVDEQKPDVVAIVGDCLCIGDDGVPRMTVVECSTVLASLRTSNIIFVRGNHEGENWLEFVWRWPHQKRPLTVLYGTTFHLGSLVLAGFPCPMGWEDIWCQTLPKVGNNVRLDPAGSGREVLPIQPSSWLPALLRKEGPASRACWLMHQPPMSLPIASKLCMNPLWAEMVERYQPMVTISGHDHVTPKLRKTWHGKLGPTTCINTGQSNEELHYCVLDFEFAGSTPSLPQRIRVQAFPWGQEISLPSK